MHRNLFSQQHEQQVSKRLFHRKRPIDNGRFYCPIIFNINGVKISGLGYNSAEEFEADLKTKLEGAASGNVQAGVDLAKPGEHDAVPN